MAQPQLETTWSCSQWRSRKRGFEITDHQPKLTTFSSEGPPPAGWMAERTPRALGPSEDAGSRSHRARCRDGGAEDRGLVHFAGGLGEVAGDFDGVVEGHEFGC